MEVKTEALKSTPESSRRPLKSRGRWWAQGLAATLARKNVNPNHISLCSLLAALLAACCFVFAGNGDSIYTDGLLFFGVVFVQLRLLCNLLDGMVAIEGGRQTKSGAFFNEFPDRIADWLILLGFGLSVRSLGYGFALGSLNAGLAMLTAYIRAFGASLDGVQDFSGPLAKPQRMAAVSATALVAIVPPLLAYQQSLLVFGNWVIALGTLFTVVRRSRNLLARLS